MACVITAPSSSSGKTLLSLILAGWAKSNGISIQPFKVGPDYLDSQLLSAISKRTCRNLDLILCPKSWVSNSFHTYGSTAELSLIEGVMGLFDGIGSSDKGSTANIAKYLNLPVVLTINAKGQAASLAALVKGFQNQDPSLKLAGVVVNHVNSFRHKELLREVLDSINVKMLGSLPSHQELALPSRHLGLIQAHEIQDIDKRLYSWVRIAEENLDLKAFKQLLKAPQKVQTQIDANQFFHENKNALKQYPIAIAEDKAFNFQYPEMKECLKALGLTLINWLPTKNEPIPNEAKGLIIPGGFPEQYAQEISSCSTSLSSLKSMFGKYPIYAECGGMMLLGNSIKDLNGQIHPMSGLLPFNAKRGQLEVGYRELKALDNSLILKKGDELIGHEFHYWELDPITSKKPSPNIHYPWEVSGWRVTPFKEGWANNYLHASWIHLHWPSSPNIINSWLRSIENLAFHQKNSHL
tara:strand:- start:36073 stop:37473 length:1401 start_codon:yes stop_codon:yes gene_type:complete